MRKHAFVNSFFFLFLAGLLSAAPQFRGDESPLAVRPADRDYSLATLVGESDHYAPTFYDDRLVTLGGTPVVQYTLVDGAPVDYYWYVTDPADLDVVAGALAKKKAKDEVPDGVSSALASYRQAVPSYSSEGLYGRVLSLIKDIASVAPQKVVGDEKQSEEVDATLYRYLVSNGISNLNDLKRRPSIVRMTVNKFYMLSTTYFYRDYPSIQAFLPRLHDHPKKGSGTLKVKVFACSTGEEVITYAIELLEAGVKDFTILGSDINESSLRYAEHMRYAGVALERLPLATQEKIKKYFQMNPDLGVWEPKDLAFFQARIKYMNQDILKDLPSNLDPRFAPPYDIVSILNVLFYLEDAAVQSRKDAWAKLVVPGGILVLHDYHYSVLNGSLGREWAFGNFLPLNEWVNVRASPSMPPEDKVAFQEALYRDSPSEGSLIALSQAYASAQKVSRIVPLSQAHLEKNPRSVTALSLLRDYGSLDRNGGAIVVSAMKKMLGLHPHSMEPLSS